MDGHNRSHSRVNPASAVLVLLGQPGARESALRMALATCRASEDRRRGSSRLHDRPSASNRTIPHLVAQATFRQVSQLLFSNALSVRAMVTRWRPGLMELAMMALLVLLTEFLWSRIRVAAASRVA